MLCAVNRLYNTCDWRYHSATCWSNRNAFTHMLTSKRNVVNFLQLNNFASHWSEDFVFAVRIGIECRCWCSCRSWYRCSSFLETNYIRENETKYERNGC